MSNNTVTKTCPACSYDTDTLVFRKWTHHEHDSGWAFEDGERVQGWYCPDCLSDIERIEKAQSEVVEDEEPTLEDWAELACRLATGLSRTFSNWQDVANTSKREIHMLTDKMGEDWQRKW